MTAYTVEFTPSLGGVLGDIDGGEEFDAVAHGDFEFVLGVLFADGGGGGGLGVLGKKSAGAGEESKE